MVFRCKKQRTRYLLLYTLIMTKYISPVYIFCRKWSVRLSFLFSCCDWRKRKKFNRLKSELNLLWSASKKIWMTRIRFLQMKWIFLSVIYKCGVVSCQFKIIQIKGFCFYKLLSCFVILLGPTFYFGSCNKWWYEL